MRVAGLLSSGIKWGTLPPSLDILLFHKKRKSVYYVVYTNRKKKGVQAQPHPNFIREATI